MPNFIKKLQLEYSKEYSEGNVLKNFTTPNIYPKIVISKPLDEFSPKEKREIINKYKKWYVYYSYRNPETGKLKRQPPIYFSVNREFPDFDERLKHIKIIRKSVEKMLNEGHSPYEDEEHTSEFNAGSALDFALNLKKNTLGDSSLSDYTIRVNVFKEYLRKKGLLNSSIKQVNKKVVTTYLNHILNDSSARNRNNTKSVLSSIFTELEKNEIIEKNFILNLGNEKTNPKRNRSFNEKEVKQIFKVLKDTDPITLLYVQLVSYNFLRPVEVLRIQVKDLDLENKRLYFKAKNKSLKFKIIPDIIINELLELGIDRFNPDDYLITPDGVGEWTAKEANKRNYFGKRFRAVKKGLGFNEDYTVYSFRHTFVARLFNGLRSSYGFSETLDKMMLITGHNTRKALLMYLRDIDAELPEDYSHLIEL